jgi:hypothetical protein
MAIKQRYSAPLFFQQGFATLTVALMISFLATFMTIYAAKVGVMEQRISANESRAEEAFAAAEAGIEEGIAYLRGNRKQIDSWGWTPCSSPTNLPCSARANEIDKWKFIQNVEKSSNYAVKLDEVNGSYSLHFLRSTDAPTYAPAVFLVVAEGKSADGSGQAIVRQGVYFYLYSNMNIPDAPLMAGGDVNISGSFSVSGNTNQGGLSVWARGGVTLGGSTQGSNIVIIDKNTLNPPKPFPTDLFEYIFGVPKEKQQVVKDEATVLTSCDTLDENSSGLYWIEGGCAPNKKNNIGSKTAPVLLVVEGDIKLNGNQKIFGLVFAFSNSTTVQLNVELNGTATVYGAVIASKNIDKANGNFDMEYDSEVLENLYSNIGSHGFTLIPGSWADY